MVGMKRPIATLAILGVLQSASSWTQDTQDNQGNDKSDALFGEFIRVPSGEFKMGSSEHRADERPVHLVKVTGLEVGQYEVTKGQWRAVMNKEPSFARFCDQLSAHPERCPVDNVTWLEVQRFIDAINVKSRRYVYRLPSEAEWEYACCAGSSLKDPADPDAVAWHSSNADRMVKATNGKDVFEIKTSVSHPVGQKQPNGWKFYDMRGNVSEWVQDWYDERYYGSSPNFTGPRGPTTGIFRVVRGGSVSRTAGWTTCSSRDKYPPTERFPEQGFRLARVPKR
jgi:formylglycine-generating enzyme required for sulfatase activity